MRLIILFTLIILLASVFASSQCMDLETQMHDSYARYTDDLVGGRDTSDSLSEYEQAKAEYDACMEQYSGNEQDGSSEQPCHEENQAVQEALDAYNAKIDSGQDATAENAAIEQAQIVYSECVDREMQKLLDDWDGSEDPVPDYDTGPCDNNHPDIKPYFDAWQAKKMAGELGTEEYKAYSDAMDECLAEQNPPETSCEDKIQNGDERGVDCGGACEEGSEKLPGEETCADGQDNDKDCLIDCEDPDCFGEAGKIDGTNYFFCEERETNCFDGFDNDADSIVDCNDFNCNGEENREGMKSYLPAFYPPDYSLPPKASPSCRCVLIAGPQNPEEKALDVVLISDNYEDQWTNLDVMSQLIEERQQVTNTLLQTVPFSEFTDNIRVWNVQKTASKSDTRFMCAMGDEFVTLDSTQGGGVSNTGWFGGDVRVYTRSPDGGEIYPYLFLHEFGHSFGHLIDEYEVSDGFKVLSVLFSTSYDNCARPDILSVGDISNEECTAFFEEEANVQVSRCYPSCYTSTWMRPQEKSIMRSNYLQTNDYTPNYGPVAEEYLRRELRKYD